MATDIGITFVYNNLYYFLVELPNNILIELLDKMADIEHRLASGSNENIQLTALISAFQYVKDITPPEDS